MPLKVAKQAEGLVVTTYAPWDFHPHAVGDRREPLSTNLSPEVMAGPAARSN